MWSVTTSSKRNFSEFHRNNSKIINFKISSKNGARGRTRKWKAIGNFVSIKLFARGWVLAPALTVPCTRRCMHIPSRSLDFLARIGFTSHLWSDGRKHCPFHALWCPLSSISRSALRPFDLWGRKIRSLSLSLSLSVSRLLLYRIGPIERLRIRTRL